MDITHIEPLLGDGLPREQAVGRQPRAPLPVLGAGHPPVGAAFEQEDGPVRIGEVGGVQAPERVVPRLDRGEDLSHLLRGRTKDLVSVDIERKHLQGREHTAFLRSLAQQ